MHLVLNWRLFTFVSFFFCLQAPIPEKNLSEKNLWIPANVTDFKLIVPVGSVWDLKASPYQQDMAKQTRPRITQSDAFTFSGVCDSPPTPTDSLRLLLLLCHLSDLSLKQLEPLGPLVSPESDTVIHHADRYLRLSSREYRARGTSSKTIAHARPRPAARSWSRKTMTQFHKQEHERSVFISYYTLRRNAGYTSSELRGAECGAVFDPDNVTHSPDEDSASPRRDFSSFWNFSGLSFEEMEK